jgi:hypothetical protein
MEIPFDRRQVHCYKELRQHFLRRSILAKFSVAIHVNTFFIRKSYKNTLLENSSRWKKNSPRKFCAKKYSSPKNMLHSKEMKGIRMVEYHTPARGPLYGPNMFPIFYNMFLLLQYNYCMLLVGN